MSEKAVDIHKFPKKPSSRCKAPSFRYKMRNSPVKIINGEHAGTYGKIHSTQYDHGIQNTTYTVLVPGQEYCNHIDYYCEGTPDSYITVPAGDCAIYHSVGSHVRVATGPWSRYHGKVTACNWDEEDKFYAVRICITADQFEAHPMDYLPHDMHETFPAHMLVPY
jgi:hypothetical protein